MAYETPEARKARRAQVQAENAQIRRERERQQKIEQGKRQGWVNPNLLTQQERLDRQLERAGLLNYQTRGQSQGDIAARFQAEGIRLTPNSSWFKQNYKSNPTSFMPQGPKPGQPTAQTQQPTTMQFATPDQVMKGQANWTDVSSQQRKQILSDPNFYKGEITKYPSWVQQQILADGEFKWDNLPWQQRLWYSFSSNPYLMAPTQGAIMGAGGGPIGVVVGATLGTLAAASGYDPNKEWWQQGGGKPTMDVGDFVRGAFGLLNWGVEGAEKGLGIITQSAAILSGNDPDFDPNKRNLDIRLNPNFNLFAKPGEGFDANLITGSSWDAGAITFEALSPALYEMGMMDNIFKLQAPTVDDVVNMIPLVQIWNLATKPEQYKGSEYILGAADPVKIQQTYYERIQEAEQRIKNGENYRVVMQEMQNGILAQVGDMVGQGIADPLNAVGDAQTIGGWALSKATGDKIAAQAFVESSHGDRPGYNDAKTRLRNIINNPAEAMKIDPNYKVSELGWLSRAMSGLTKDMQVKAGPFARNTGLFDYTKPKNKISGFIDAIKYYTPESRARVGQDLLLRNLGGIMSSYFNGVDVAGFAKWWKAFSNGDMTQARDLSNAMAQAPEFYTVLPAAKNFDVDGQLAAWQAGEAPRADISRIADALGENPMTLIESLVKRDDGATVLQERLRTKNNDAAKSVLADIEAGRMDLGVLTEASKGFFDGSIPYSPGQWFANTLNAIKDHYDTWAIDHFNLDEESRKTLFRVSSILKSAQSILLLGANPGYMISNVLPTMVTRAAAGVFGYMTPGAIDAYMSRMGFALDDGFAPSRIDEGVGPGGMVDQARQAGDPIRNATRGKGWLTSVENIVGRIGSAMPFNKWSRVLEGYEGKQAYVIGIKQFMGEAWRRGKFRELPKPLVDELTRVAGRRATDILYSAIEAGMTKDDIANIVQQGSRQVQARSLINQAANDMNIPVQQAASMLEKLGVLDALDAAMKNARTESGMRGAFERARKEAITAMDRQAAVDATARIEHVANRLNTEGMKAIADIALDTEAMGIENWLKHYERMGDVAEAMDSINDANQRSRLWSIKYAESNAEFRRYNAHRGSTYLGILKAVGLEADPNGRGFLSTLADTDRAIDQAYRTMRDLRDQHFKKWNDDYDNPRRAVERDAIERQIEAAWKKATKTELDNSAKMGEYMGKQYETLYGVEAGEAARQAWEQITAFRKEMTGRRDAFRKTQNDTRVNGVSLAARQAAAREFWGKTYQYMIVEMQRIKTEAIRKLDAIANRRRPGGDMTGPLAPNDPNAPTRPPAEDVLRGVWNSMEVGTNIEDRLNVFARRGGDNTAAPAQTEPTPPTQPPAGTFDETQIRQNIKERGYATSEEADYLRSIGVMRDIQSPLTPKQQAQMMSSAKAGNDSYRAMLAKAEQGLPLTIKEAEGFSTGVPEGYVKQGDMYIKQDEMAALRQAAEQRAAERKAKISTVWDTAEGFGFNRAKDVGALMAALRKYGEADISGWDDPRLTPEYVADVLNKRNEIKAQEQATREANAAEVALNRAQQDFITKPRSELAPGVSEALMLEAQRIADVVTGGEPGRRQFAGGEFIGATKSTYPKWYNELQGIVGGKKKLLNALDKIVLDAGKDKGVVVERVKEFLLMNLKWGDDETGQPPNLRVLQDLGADEATMTRALDEFNTMMRTNFTMDEVLAGDYSSAFDNYYADEVSTAARVDGDMWQDAMVEAAARLDRAGMDTLIEQLMPEMYDQPMNGLETYGEFITRLNQELDTDLKAEAERMAVAEAMTRSEEAVKAQQAEAEKTFTRQRFYESLTDVFGLDEQQVNAVMEVTDAAAKWYANATGLDEGAYYRDYIEDVQRAGMADLFQIAYHGSPYKFDRFTLEKIGSGEGAQAYGWGLYFAGDKSVGEYYRQKLSNNDIITIQNNNGDIVYEGDIRKAPDGYVEAFKVISRHGNKSESHFKYVNLIDNEDVYFGQYAEIENKLNVLEKERRSYPSVITDRTEEQKARINEIDEEAFSLGNKLVKIEINKKTLEAIRETVNGKYTFKQQDGGQLYRVDIPDDGYLLWDRPLSKQPENVRQIINKAFNNPPEGFDRYEWKKAFVDAEYLPGAVENALGGMSTYYAISKLLGGDKKASLYLKELGLSGIKFLDGNSRGITKWNVISKNAEGYEINAATFPTKAEADAHRAKMEEKGYTVTVDEPKEGNYNYVIFDDAAIQILETYYQMGEYPDNGIGDLRKLLDDYEEGANLTVNDVITEAEAIFKNNDMPDAEEIINAIEDYRATLEEDFTQFGLRGDSSNQADNLVDKLTGYIEKYKGELYQRDTQPGLFGAGEDTPLFSGVAQRAQAETYTPTDAGRQEAMFDMRPQFGTKEPSLEPKVNNLPDYEIAAQKILERKKSMLSTDYRVERRKAFEKLPVGEKGYILSSDGSIKIDDRTGEPIIATVQKRRADYSTGRRTEIVQENIFTYEKYSESKGRVVKDFGNAGELFMSMSEVAKLQEQDVTAPRRYGPKGGVQFLDNGKAIIRAWDNADVTTVIHESAHIFRRMMKDVAERTGNKQVIRDLDTLEKWAGVKDGNWDRAAEEKFARGFERYLADGTSPTPKLKQVFKQIKTWMLSIYKGITGSAIDIDLTPQVKEVFDRLLTGEVEARTLDAGDMLLQMGFDPKAYYYDPLEGKPKRRYSIDQTGLRDVSKEKASAAANEVLAGMGERLRQLKQETRPAGDAIDPNVTAPKNGTPIHNMTLDEFRAMLYEDQRSRAQRTIDRLTPENTPEWTTYEKYKAKLEAQRDRNYLVPETYGNPREKWMGAIERALTESLPVKDEIKQAYYGMKNGGEWLYQEKNNPIISGYNVSEELINNLRKATEGFDVDAYLSEKDGVITLHDIIVPKKSRNQGVGTRFMEALTKYADQNNKTIVLTAAGDFGGSRAGQERFYKRQGFVKNKDYRYRENMIRRPSTMLFQEAEPTDSPAFRRWFGNSKVVDENGRPLVVYHGSTFKFDSFTWKDKGNPENHFGRAYYFTNNETDVRSNYAGAGPDLTSKVDATAERILNDILDNMDNPPQYNTAGYKKLQKKAETQARKMFNADAEGQVYEVYVKMDNPAYFTNDENATRFFFEFDEDGNESGNALDLYNAIIETGADYGIDGQDVWNTLNEKLGDYFVDIGVTAKDIDEALREDYNLMDLSDDNGNMVNSEFIRDVFRNAGYDGFVQDANLYFGQARKSGKAMEGVDYGTYHYIIFEPTQAKSINNRGTWDPNNPNILFQEADPRMPLGGYEETANWMPLGDAMNEGWRDHVAPLLDKMEDIAVQRLNEPTMDGAYRDLSPEGQRMLRNYLAGVQQDLASTKMSALRWGAEKRDNVMLNYNKRTGLDQMLDVVFPYQFFYTRSMMTWAMRAMDNPAWLSNYARIRNQQDRYENNLPERLRGKMRIAAPWMPDWMGDAVYIDPLSVLFTPHNFMRPFEQMMKDENMQTIEAERILQEWAASESVPQEQIVEAAKTRSGDLWDKAMAEAKVRREAEISNPLDFVSATFGPAWYLSTPAKLLGLGKDGPETVTELPITRTARALDTVTNDTWAEPIGNLFGLLAKPEQVFREKNNLPEFGEYGDYYIDRQLANMVAEERITPEEAQIAMIERQGENFEIARERVQLELAMRIPLMGAIYAGLNEGAGAGLQALPASFFGAGVLPQGELEYRGLKDEWNEAWKRRDAGDTEAINRFFEDHPEYEAYLAKGKEPEDRLRSFLIGQIWDGYMSLGETDRKMASAELGDDFRQAFLNKETRSYDVLDVNTLTQWAQLLNKRVPKVEQTLPAIESPMPPIDYFSPEVSAITDKFYEQRRTLYPDYYEVEQGYYDLPKSERRAYLLAHPELKEYWTWKDGWYDRYPELVPVFKGEVFKTVDFSGWNPMLIEYVASYAYAGEDIPAGAYKALEQQWIREGRPRGSVDDWLRIDVAPAMLFGD